MEEWNTPKFDDDDGDGPDDEEWWLFRKELSVNFLIYFLFLNIQRQRWDEHILLYKYLEEGGW